MEFPGSSSEDKELEQEVYPVEPRYHPIHKLPRKIYDFLASSRLAMALLVAILVCCIAGVTVWRGAEAGRMIFGTLWFNLILVLMVINVACCFFGRIWGRRLTLVSFGMILFHLSFVTILLGVVYNSLFYFRGNIRLTEGESLPSNDPSSYDRIEQGRFFNISRLRGETSLIKVQTGFKADGQNKKVAYEVAVGEGAHRKQELIYVTHKLSHRGVDYFNDKEGYSLLVTLSDRQGKELYGAHLPLQSIPQKNGSFKYTTGYKDDGKVQEAPMPFPAPPEKALMAMQLEYILSNVKERDGEALFQMYPLDQTGTSKVGRPYADGKVPIGQPFAVGEYLLTTVEVRYWVWMTVRYEPGKPIVLASLWVGLAGMIITTLGRMLRRRT